MKETLRLLREQNNFSQARIAEYLGISRQIYLKYESGEVEPGVRVIKALCELYKVSYETIIENQLNPNSFSARFNFSHNSELKIASPEKYSVQSAVSTFTTEENFFLKKLKQLSQEKKNIVFNLIDSLFQMDSFQTDKKKNFRCAGGISGKIFIADDFDDTPECFNEYLPGEKC